MVTFTIDVKSKHGALHVRSCELHNATGRLGRGRRRQALQPREQLVVDEVRPVVVRAVADAFQHVEHHVGELRRQLGEELPHGPVDRGERVPVAPQHQHGDVGQPRHQRYWARTRRAGHRRHEGVQGALAVSWSPYDLRMCSAVNFPGSY
jgi:hypothetical protein